MAEFNTEYYKGTDRYSDGDIEDTILDLVRSGARWEDRKDRSFPILYHLSPVRENILSWYSFRKGAQVLEIGAGPGAITGLLCRKAADGHVTSVELSERRARINYERHRDLDNLTILVGNMNDMELAGKYDYVILNGVFEYAASFTEGDDPYGTFLKTCMSYLKADGILLIAIENRLGLKYFAGAPEDHTENYLEGIKGYPGKSGVKTFSRTEWEALAARCHLASLQFYYPYPDYKFPNEIFTDASLSADGFKRNAWNFNPNRLELFPEAEMASTLVKEGVMNRFMNSFLIEASRSDLKEVRGTREVLYAKINSDRAEQYRIQTVITEEADGTRAVTKCALGEAAQKHLDRMHAWETAENDLHLLKGSRQPDGSIVYPYLTIPTLEDTITGNAASIRKAAETLYALIRNTAGSGAGTAQTVRASGEMEANRARFEELFGTAQAERDYEMVDPANLDLIFNNVFSEESGDPLIIDGEWIVDTPVPAAFLLWRAVNELYSNHPEFERELPIAELFSSFGIGAEDRRVFWKWASHFEKEYVKANGLAAYAQPLRKADLKDLKWSGENVRLTAALYLDKGSGYNEQDALHNELVIEKGKYQVTFEIPQDSSIRSMRFDPLEGSACICRLSSEEVSLKPMNASAKSERGDVFLTLDPAYHAEWGRQLPAKISITGQVSLQDVYWALAKSQELLNRSRKGPVGVLAGRIRNRAR